MIKKLRNQPYAPKWEQEEKRDVRSAILGHSTFVVPNFLQWDWHTNFWGGNETSAIMKKLRNYGNK
jgi:hypothetical protein